MKVEEGFGAAVKIQQLAVLLVLVMNIKAHQHGADAKIEHGKGAKKRVSGSELGALFEQIRLALEHYDRTGKNEDEQKLSGEDVAVIGKRADGNARAKRQTVGLVAPLGEHSDARLGTMEPILGAGAVPGLGGSFVRLHVER